MKQDIYKRNLLIPFLKIIFDGIAIELAVLSAYYLRFYSPLTGIIPVTKGYPQFQGYFYFSLFLMAVMIFLFGAFNAYRSRYFSSFSQDIPVLFKVCVLGILFAMSGAFLYRDFSYSRLVFAMIYLNLNLFLLIERWMFHRLKKRFLRRGFGILKVLLIGSGENLLQVYRRLQSDQNYNFEVAGYLAEQKHTALPVDYLGKPEELNALLTHSVDYSGLLISFNHTEHDRIWPVIQAVEGKNLELFYVPDILDLLTSRFQSLEVGGVPLLQLKRVALSGWQGLIKRGFDLVSASLGLLLLSPLFLLLALLIKMTSRGPVFYVQPRVSLDGQEFKMLKFRSMRADAESATGPVWASKGDPRVTGLGRFLRRSSLDELPQLINVIKGEMSLVGPRPERQHFVDQFRASIPHYLERHRFRCGMTGWAQVNGLRGQSPIEVRTRYDLYYIENWSLWFDLKIIILTFMEIFRGENAY